MWVNEETGNVFKDHHFSKGYTIGYHGLLFAKRRFSFAHGLQYSYVSAYIDDYNIMPRCGNGLEDFDFEPYRYEEKWNNIEMPIGAQYNILKGSKFQPYVSLNIILIYPITYEAKLINQSGIEVHDLGNDNYKIRLDGNVELGFGLKYSTNNYIFNLHPFFRPGDITGYQGKSGVGFAILRNF